MAYLSRESHTGWEGIVTLREWLRVSLEEKEWSQMDLARRLSAKMNRSFYSSTISNMLQGKRKIKADEAIAISELLAVPLPIQEARQTVPLVGYVGAGASATMFNVSQDSYDYVDSPPEASDKTVAVEVRGDSMYGLADDGWLIYYDDRSEPVTEDLIGRLCVVGTSEHGTLVKKLESGSQPGRYNLVSSNASPIRNVEVEWAARVTWIRPR